MGKRTPPLPPTATDSSVVETLRREVQSLQDAHAQDMKEKDNTIAAGRETIRGHEATITALQAQLKAVKSVMSTTTTAPVARKSAAPAVLRSDVSKQLSEARKAADAHAAEVKDLKQQLADLSKQKSSSDAAAAAIKVQLDAKNHESAIQAGRMKKLVEESLAAAAAAAGPSTAQGDVPPPPPPPSDAADLAPETLLLFSEDVSSSSSSSAAGAVPAPDPEAPTAPAAPPQKSSTVKLGARKPVRRGLGV